MINSYFRTTSNKSTIPGFSSSSRLPIDRFGTQAKYKKYKLMLLILTRATFKTLKLTYDTIYENSRSFSQILNKLAQHCEKNINLTVHLAFDKIKIASSQQKSS